MLTYGGYTSSAMYLDGGVLSLAASAEIEIRNESDGALSTLFTAPTGGAKTNPFNADASGRFDFFAAGREDGFRVKVTKSGQEYTLRYQRVSNLYVDMTSYTATLLLAANAGAARTVLDVPSNAEAARLDTENQALVGGVSVTSKDLGTMTTGTITPDPGDRPAQHYINGGAHTLAPSGVVGSTLVDITNNASAGTITTSGFTKVAGDAFTTTNGHKFRCSISIGNAGSLLVVRALQ